MPKKLFQVARFEGGINNVSATVDLEDTELVEAQNVNTSIMGKIVLMGTGKYPPRSGWTPPSIPDYNFSPGYGLASFSSDRRLDGAQEECDWHVWHHGAFIRSWDNSSATEGAHTEGQSETVLTDSEQNWVADALIGHRIYNITDGSYGEITDNTDTQIWVAQLIGGTDNYWETGDEYMVSGVLAEFDETEDVKPEFTFHKGILTICDGNFSNANTRKWFGYIDHTTYNDVTVAGMYNEDADLTAPTGGEWVDDYPDAGAGINITGNTGEEGGSIEDVTLEFGCSFIYDNFQETPIYYDPEGATANGFGANGEGLISDIYIKIKADYNKRVKGGRIYCRDTADISRTWRLMYDVDFAEGWRASLDNSYQGEFTSGGDGEYYIEPDDYTVLSPETFDTINGYDYDDNIDCKYKTAVEVQGIIYAGNVCQNGVHYPDRMIKSASAREGVALDVFPESNFIDVATGDGDAIVKLETYADKVLQFKRQKLYVIAYSGDVGDFIEAEYPYMGITHPGHSTVTPRGVVFMNTSGVHIYNEEGITTLTTKIDEGRSTDSGVSKYAFYTAAGYQPWGGLE